jgi:hypothetical protein
MIQKHAAIIRIGMLSTGPTQFLSSGNRPVVSVLERPELEADHSPQSSAEVYNIEIITPLSYVP